MKKRILILTLMLSLLILFGCEEKEDLSNDDKGGENTETVQTPETDQIPQTEATPTDEELAVLMGLGDGQEIISRYEQDYDGSGKYQAFVSVGNSADLPKAKKIPTQLWFCSDDFVKKLLDSYELVIYGEHTFGDDKIFVASESYATGDLVSIFHVKDGEVNVDKISRTGGVFEQTSSTEMTLYHSVTDGAVFGGGRSWKRYWFYWDGEADCFREYGAVEIDASSPKDADIKRAIKNIEYDGGTVEKVFYRANDVININYVDGEAYRNYSFKKDGETWEPITVWEENTDELQRCAGYGRYLEALVPDSAVYPTDDSLAALMHFSESDIEPKEVIEDTRYYKLIFSKDLSFFYYIYDEDHNIVVSDGPIYKEPHLSMTEGKLVKLTLQTGTGLGTQWGYYYDTETDIISETFSCIYDECGGLVAYGGKDRVIIRDIFDENKYRIEISGFKQPLSISAEPIVGAEFTDDGKSIMVSYMTGTDYSIVTEIFDLKI